MAAQDSFDFSSILTQIDGTAIAGQSYRVPFFAESFDEGYTAGYTAGYAAGFTAGVASVVLHPTITNESPDENVQPGGAGGFSATFRVARLTPIVIDLDGVTVGAKVTACVRFADRNETYQAVNLSEQAVWPFDIITDNFVANTGGNTRRLQLLPRGGWPATQVTIDIGAGVKAV